ncbi:unnamed protein product [Didymodactylos carnosus]|uniref:Uncharacterized protein n=1 Tax=Didymodactylos carnosus TaxID=1234261 RepID=A0A815WIB6_9BILA|nr:unnamed protein product [Didymodactylos carnosus]CAF1543869.1 unnamed protein product [Didymodactylos carnosus]CAF4268118.1 unnamed protein product [Didymodactylos carnosus]CAF4404326.1 unnamed protein product [Didymodactylos carnosus]
MIAQPKASFVNTASTQENIRMYTIVGARRTAPLLQNPDVVISTRNKQHAVIKSHIVTMEKSAKQRPQLPSEPRSTEKERPLYEFREQNPAQPKKQNYVNKRWAEEPYSPRMKRNPTQRAQQDYTHPSKAGERLHIGTHPPFDYIDGTHADNREIHQKRLRYDRVSRRRAIWLPVWT